LSTHKPPLSTTEFVILIALMTSLTALSISAMLPVLPIIGQDLNIAEPNDLQLIVSVMFLGLTVTQLFYGPLSDSIGRKKCLYIAFTIFQIGTIFSILAQTFELMLIGRFLQGMGAAGPRIICMALVRDQYEGRDMARIMSYVMTVFIIVPALAPAIGQGVEIISHWRMIFVLFFALALISALWLAFRQPETLPPSNRREFSLRSITSGFMTTCRNRTTLAYALISGLITSAFVAYLLNAQQLFSDIYGITDQFPLYFAALALAIGLASYLNARMVMKVGMRRLCAIALTVLTLLSVLISVYAAITGGQPTIAITMGYFLPAFMCIGILFSNTSSLALEPLGHMAGMAASVVALISSLISVVLGWFIGQMYDGTIIPLVSGFALLSISASIIMFFMGKRS
jgi:DHA1 family bicyclomycin/chloramphenicol resistance-like MFS transporter